MVARARASLMRLVVAALIAALAAGAGLPGLARAFAGDGHVCTCASGASHARCPVCNPALGRHARCARLRVEGVPCGERTMTAGIGVEPGLAPPILVDIMSPRSRSAASPVVRSAPEDVERQPATPPPRSLPG
jgi:hypothetical protein